MLPILRLSQSLAQIKPQRCFHHHKSVEEGKIFRKNERAKLLECALPTLKPETLERILSSSVDELLSLQLKGVISAVEITAAYLLQCKKNANRDIVFEAFPEEALQWAKKMDEYRDDHQELKGHLHGIPTLIKAYYPVKGYRQFFGSAEDLKGGACEESGPLVVTLENHGAVILGTSNLSQNLTLMASGNAISEKLQNFFQNSRTAAGSSSGSTLALKYKCVPLSIGSDFCGSIRLPAEFQGVLGFRPTPERFDLSRLRFHPALVSIFGGFANNARDLISLTRALLSNSTYDLAPHLPRQPLRMEMLNEEKKLTFGFMEFKNTIAMSESIRNALEECRSKLEVAGHNVVTIDGPDCLPHVDTWYKLYWHDGGNRHLSLKNMQEPLIPQVQELSDLVSLSDWKKWLLQTWYSLTSNRYMEIIMDTLRRPRSPDEMTELRKKRTEFQSEMFELWKGQDVDVVITPNFLLPAPKEPVTFEMEMGAPYVYLNTLLDVPIGVQPISEFGTESYEGKCDRSPFGNSLADQFIGAKGLPISVQILSYPGNDEVVLRAMETLENSLGRN